MEDLKIKSFLIEFRQRLQSANVFLTFNENLSKNSETKIQLKINEILINVDNHEYKIDINSHFHINIKSICNLIIKNNSISFRFNTNNVNFEEELLKLSLEDQSAKNHQSESVVNISCNENYSINCSNCKTFLVQNPETGRVVNFERILELPSAGLDLNDWFCHKPHSLIVSDNKNSDCINENIIECHKQSTVSNLFKPKKCDLFYSNFYMLINRNIIDIQCLRQKNNFIYCKRCLNYLGEFVSNDSIKFWCENVSFNDDLSFYKKKNVLDNIIDLIKLNIADTSLMYLSSIVKIIFEAKLPKNGNQLFLLLQIMDKNLDLYKLDLESFQLQKTKGIKIMYHMITIDKNEKDTDDIKTLNYWKKDIDTVNYEISSIIYYKLCKYLDSNSKFIPDFYRKNNLFYLSYIDL